MQFVLVTPSYNLGGFIDQTIYSVLGQAGDFTLRYHVQDGGSTDETRNILNRWAQLVASPDFPKFCREVSFSSSTEPDYGMYDAINRGFDIARDKTVPSIMSWINADDQLLPGALSAVASFFEQNPAAQLVGGRTAVMSSEGFLWDVGHPRGRSRASVAEGRCDGRDDDFIMQEGTFWRSDLWDQVGGLDGKLRYAGDFDLWRRFARHTEYSTLDSLTGCHRKREGQLSSDMSAYYAEVDAILESSPLEARVTQNDDGFFKYNTCIKKWQFHPDIPTINTIKWRALGGFSMIEGPFPEIMLAFARWIIAFSAKACVYSETNGDCMITMHFRNPTSNQKIWIEGQLFEVKSAEMEKRISISIPFMAKKGWNNIVIRVNSLIPESGGSRQLGIFVEDITIKKEITNVARRPWWRRFILKNGR